MRILYLHRGYFPALAGAEMMTRRLAELMHQRGHTVSLLCRSRGLAVERYGDLFPVVGTPSLDVALVQEQLDWRPDLVHVFDAVWPDFPQAALSLAQRWAVPLVVTPASTVSVWEDVPASMAVCRAADLVFVLTPAERAVFAAAGVPDDRLVAIGQGADLAGCADPAGFRRQYAIDGPLILYVGRKAAFKGYQRLLAATALVWERYPRAHFVFVGPHWDADSHDRFAAHADPRIHDVGMVSEETKHHALAACDMLCLPSTADVFPIVFVEAWMCGKPVITADFPGSADVVCHAQDGLIVEARPEAVAAAIIALLDQPERAAALGMAGLDRVRRQLNWAAVADAVELSYRRLMPGPAVEPKDIP